MDFSNISIYDMGILWSIGSKISDSCFLLRHKDRYFLDRIKKYCSNTVYSQKRVKGKDDIQYVLKIYDVDFDFLYKIGWTNRWSDARSLPALTDYADFLRAFLELHSCLDYSTRYSGWTGKKWKALRLRIYGNYDLISDINKVLYQYVNTTLKKVGTLHNDKSAVLTFTSLKEINMIYDYVFDSPFFKPYWDDVDFKLQYPKME